MQLFKVDVSARKEAIEKSGMGQPWRGRDLG